MSLLPVVAVSGSGRALFEPIWAQDVALSHEDIIEICLRAAGRPRRRVHVPLAIVSRALRSLEALLRSRAFATGDEAELMEVTMIAARGAADVEDLGVTLRSTQAVLGAA